MDDSTWEHVEREARETGNSLSQVVISAIAHYFRSKIVRDSSWDTEEQDAWYDEDRYYTYSQDKFGHSAAITVTIPKSIAGEVAGIIDSGKYPELRTPQDFYRNAIRHWSYQMGKRMKDESLIHIAEIMTLKDSVAAEQAEVVDYHSLENAIRDSLDYNIIMGHYEYAEAKLKEYWRSVNSIPERFRPAYMEMLKEFGGRVRQYKGTPAAKTQRGTYTTPDGRIFKNGIELKSEVSDRMERERRARKKAAEERTAQGEE